MTIIIIIGLFGIFFNSSSSDIDDYYYLEDIYD